MIENAHAMAGGWDLKRKASIGTLAMFCLQRPPLQHTTPSDRSAGMVLSVCMYTSHAHQDDYRHRHFVLEPNSLQPPLSHDDMRSTQIACLAPCGIYTLRRHPPRPGLSPMKPIPGSDVREKREHPRNAVCLISSLDALHRTDIMTPATISVGCFDWQAIISGVPNAVFHQFTRTMCSRYDHVHIAADRSSHY